MKKTFYNCTLLLLLTGLFISDLQPLQAQSGASEVLDSASLKEQLDYINEKTRVYNDYRAIRDDIFLKLRRNVIDTLNDMKLEVEQLNSRLTERNFQIETLNSDLTRTQNEKDEAIRNKDSFSFFGILLGKALYNTIMWLIVLGLGALAVVLVLLFKRTNHVTNQVKNELMSLQEEFEDYKKNSREKYEKLVVSHHNEIMKLKNS
jgi:ABC-type multidrug transport system fused ATPase/permease subunit